MLKHYQNENRKYPCWKFEIRPSIWIHHFRNCTYILYICSAYKSVPKLDGIGVKTPMAASNMTSQWVARHTSRFPRKHSGNTSLPGNNLGQCCILTSPPHHWNQWILLANGHNCSVFKLAHLYLLISAVSWSSLLNVHLYLLFLIKLLRSYLLCLVHKFIYTRSSALHTYHNILASPTRSKTLGWYACVSPLSLIYARSVTRQTSVSQMNNSHHVSKRDGDRFLIWQSNMRRFGAGGPQRGYQTGH